MNCTRRLSITLLALSFHQISFSMYPNLTPQEMNQTDSARASKETTITLNNARFYVRPAFNFDPANDMTNAIDKFARSLLTEKGDLSYYPLLMIHRTNEWLNIPKIRNIKEYNQVEISFKNQFAILHLVPGNVTPHIQTILATIEFMEIMRRTRIKMKMSILTTPVLPLEQDVSLSSTTTPIPQVAGLIQRAQVTSVFAPEVAEWRRMPIARTPQQILAPQKTIGKTKPTIQTYSVNDQTKFQRYPQPAPAMPTTALEPKQATDAQDNEPFNTKKFLNLD